MYFPMPHTTIYSPVLEGLKSFRLICFSCLCCRGSPKILCLQELAYISKIVLKVILEFALYMFCTNQSYFALNLDSISQSAKWSVPFLTINCGIIPVHHDGGIITSSHYSMYQLFRLLQSEIINNWGNQFPKKVQKRIHTNYKFM